MLFSLVFHLSFFCPSSSGGQRAGGRLWGNPSFFFFIISSFNACDLTRSWRCTQIVPCPRHYGSSSGSPSWCGILIPLRPLLTSKVMTKENRYSRVWVWYCHHQQNVALHPMGVWFVGGEVGPFICCFVALNSLVARAPADLDLDVRILGSEGGDMSPGFEGVLPWTGSSEVILAMAEEMVTAPIGSSREAAVWRALARAAHSAS